MPASCTHCGLPVPAGLVAPDREAQFCCHGCETAYEVIHRCGLDRYYALKERNAGAARTSGRSYAEFDDETFRAMYVRRDAAGTCHAELFLSGMHCAACVWLIERLPRLLKGVSEARVDLGRSLVTLSWDDGAVRLSEIARVLDSIGYPPTPARDAKARAQRRAEDRRQLVRLAVAGACAGNVMLFAVSLYAGAFGSMEPAFAQLFRWASLVLTLVSLAWPGRVFFASAWYAVRTRSVHFDVPIALALAAGAMWSIWSTVMGTLHPEAAGGAVYFDTVSVLVFALLIGRFLQSRQQRFAADSVELLFSLTPSVARRLKVGGWGELEEVPAQALASGDIIEVRPGECLPADGEVMTGHSAVDQAVLTGESSPVDVGPGGRVAAGTVNVTSVLRVRVAATGEATRLGKLMRLIEEGARRRAPIVEFADRVAGHFTIGMLVLAGVTLSVWLWLDATHAIDHAVALLVVTCPCALGLATPLVMTVAMGRAARRHMLIKGGDAIQRLATRRVPNSGTIFLDKTGTITEGGFTLAAWIGDESAKPLVALIERQSNHPAGVALARDCGQPAAGEVFGLQHQVGGGLAGIVAGRRVVVGSPAYALSACTTPSDALLAALAQLPAQGLTPVAVAVDGQLVAVAGLGDRVRDDAAASVRRLQTLGYRVGILSGDHPEVVARVARELGIHPEDARGGQTPEMKLEAVHGAKVGGPVIMVGDGVNDAAALAAADVGVAVHGGVEASLAAADVYLGAPGLTPLVELIEASRRTMNTIRRNLWVSLFYNVSAGTLAAFGLVSPIVAALIMPLSSLTAVTISLRSRTFDSSPRAGGKS
ncbi:MAG: heavy metal translocating P-type ATPase [Phycisphaerales bacterium]